MSGKRPNLTQQVVRRTVVSWVDCVEKRASESGAGASLIVSLRLSLSTVRLSAHAGELKRDPLVVGGLPFLRFCWEKGGPEPPPFFRR